MRIGIIGAGNVGGTLGTAWSRLGHDVVFALRNPDDPKSVALLRGAPNAKGASTRSEERRVGKECRSRWSPYH